MNNEIISCIKNKVNSYCDLEINVFENDSVIRLKVPERFKSKKQPFFGSKRGHVSKFSKKSVSRLKFCLNNLSPDFDKMITLTYPSDFPCDGKIVKRDLDKYFKCLKRKYPDSEYVCTLEFQDRGAPHFHIVVKCPNFSALWSSNTWYRIVGSGDINHLAFGSHVQSIEKNAYSYLYDYIGKLDQKTVPHNYVSVGRFWSCSQKILKSFKKTISCLPASYLLKQLRLFKRFYQHKWRSIKTKKHPNGFKYQYKAVSCFKFLDSNDFLVNEFWNYLLNNLKIDLGVIIEE